MAPNEIIKYSILSLNNGDTDLHDIVFREIFEKRIQISWIICSTRFEREILPGPAKGNPTKIENEQFKGRLS